MSPSTAGKADGGVTAVFGVACGCSSGCSPPSSSSCSCERGDASSTIRRSAGPPATTRLPRAPPGRSRTAVTATGPRMGTAASSARRATPARSRPGSRSTCNRCSRARRSPPTPRSRPAPARTATRSAPPNGAWWTRRRGTASTARSRTSIASRATRAERTRRRFRRHLHQVPQGRAAAQGDHGRGRRDLPLLPFVRRLAEERSASDDRDLREMPRGLTLSRASAGGAGSRR